MVENMNQRHRGINPQFIEDEVTDLGERPIKLEKGKTRIQDLLK